MASGLWRCSQAPGWCLPVLLALAALGPPHGRLGAAAAEGSGGKWHVAVSVSSLLPGAVCTATEAAPNSSSTLTVVHRHGPCSPLRSSRGGPRSHAEILRRDRESVDAINHKLHGATAASKGGADVTLETRWGKPLGTSNYFISVGLGTPARALSVEFDTGSVQSWVQCEPCADCYQLHDPLFDPAQSSTYSPVSCGAHDCREFGSQSSSQNCSSESDSPCQYEVSYGDNSQTKGTLARDTLTLTPATTVHGFMFGSGHKDSGIFGEVDGSSASAAGRRPLLDQIDLY